MQRKKIQNRLKQKKEKNRGKTKISSNVKHLLVNDFGKFFPAAETAVANTRPRSAITVNVKGIPINANSMQKPLPAVVVGTMLP